MIKVSENIRIVRTDEKNLQIEEYRKVINKKTKEERYEWCWLGYYGDLRTAIGGVLKHCLMSLADEEITTLSQLIERIDEVEKELKGRVKNEN